MSYLADVLATSGLLNYWPLADPSGTVADDASAAGNDGTYVNTPTLGQPGPAGMAGAALFNGTDEYASLGDRGVSEQSAFSVEIWAKWTTTTVGILCGEGSTTSATTYMYIANLASGAVSVWRRPVGLGAVSRDSAVTGLNDGQWHQIVITKSGTTVKLYVDGAQTGADLTISATNVAVDRTGAAMFLRAGETDPFGGTLASLSTYNVALSAGTIAAHYTAGITPLPAIFPRRPQRGLILR